jgi:Predicted transcriptional regulators
MYYKRLRECREDKDFSQRQLSRLLDMPQTQYIRYEQGKVDLPSKILVKLCLIYNVSADYILELPKGLNFPR